MDGYESTEAIGLPPVVADLATFPTGFIVVHGPDFEATSITLAAMISQEEARAAAEHRPMRIVLVGDLRDHRVTERALELAASKLVLASFDEADAARAIRGTIEAFPPDRWYELEIQIGSTLSALIGPELVPATDGRSVVAAQILVIYPPLRSLISWNKLDSLNARIPLGSRFGNQTRASAYAKLANAGRITKESAAARCPDALELLRES
jgi:twitching motility protein PilT